VGGPLNMARSWPSLRQAPPESLRRSGPEARRDRAATRAQRAILTASTQGFRMRAPEGWPVCNPRATADVAARSPVRSAAGLSSRRRRRGPKGQRKAAGAWRVTIPRGGQPAPGGSSATPQSASPLHGALACTEPSRAPARSARP